MTLDENKAKFRLVYEEILNKGNIDLFDELCAPNFVKHTQQPGTDYGIEGSKQSVIMLRNAFPDITYTVEDLIAEGDKVVARWSAQGTHQGEFMGIPPTNKQVRFSGIEIIRLVDGKAVEEWEELDRLGLMTQLGVIPT
ncbi:ester cyclase [Candidatus Bathyarchaeota archaeon]|nr:MAG: ester cyclase [Candidatus Bathyarchaeota archaeon]